MTEANSLERVWWFGCGNSMREQLIGCQGICGLFLFHHSKDVLILRFLGRGVKKNLNLEDPSFSSEDSLTQKACSPYYEDIATQAHGFFPKSAY